MQALIGCSHVFRIFSPQHLYLIDTANIERVYTDYIHYDEHLIIDDLIGVARSFGPGVSSHTGGYGRATAASILSKKRDNTERGEGWHCYLRCDWHSGLLASTLLVYPMKA